MIDSTADAAHDIDEWMRGALCRWLDRTGSDRIVDGPIAEPYRLQEKATVSLARQKLRQKGAWSVPVGPRRATRAHPLGLTPRECEVLELICE